MHKNGNCEVDEWIETHELTYDSTFDLSNEYGWGVDDNVYKDVAKICLKFQ